MPACSHLRHRVRAVLFSVGAAALVAGCHAPPCVNPPAELTGRTWENRAPTGDTYPDPAATVRAGLAAACGPPATPAPTDARPLNVLVLSGGGKYGAFCAGVLNGWSAAGTRPRFDAVTGISSGALVAVYAFLGPEYDDRLAHTFTDLCRKDLYRFCLLRGPFTHGALATTEPFAARIEREVNDAVIDDIRKAHAEGRRLFVATGNRTTYRPVIWDVGAIASSGRPDANTLVRKILLAAASMPGLTPAVEFDVEVNGERYTELHGDGGNIIQAFVRTPNGLPPGSDVYLLTAGMWRQNAIAERPGVVGVVTAAASTTLYALYRADVMQVHALCGVTRSRFHLLNMPSDVPVRAGSVNLDPAELRLMYETGYQTGAAGGPWRSTPPGVEPGETLTPRTGLEFVVPVTP